MKTLLRLGCLALMAGLLSLQAQTAQPTPALAVVVVYDGSGSMANMVPNAKKVPTPKYLIANKAVVAIATKVNEFCTNKNVNVEAGLVFFADSKVRTAIPLQTFDRATFNRWAAKFKSPRGGTPLGVGIQEAAQMLEKSQAPKKHILVVTDGESNQGISPEEAIKEWKSKPGAPAIYFVAFDVSAKAFDAVKAQGALVVSASDELQLKTQIDSILGKRILLEAE